MFDQTLIFTLGRGKQAHGRVISPAVSVQPELSARIVHNAGRRFTRESRTVPFDRDVNARDLLGIVMDFMADV